MSFFSSKIPGGIISVLNPKAKETIIFDLEALAVLVGCLQLLPAEAVLQNDRVVIFVDNEAVLGKQVSGRGGESIGDTIIQQVLLWEHDSGAISWYERVPSAANVADAPSRANVSGLDEDLAIDVDVSDVLIVLYPLFKQRPSEMSMGEKPVRRIPLVRKQPAACIVVLHV